MNLKPTTVLGNEYQQVETLDKASGVPIIITDKSEVDWDVLSVEAFEEREKTLNHRASILEAECARLGSAPTYSVEEIRARLKEKYANA